MTYHTTLPLSNFRVIGLTSLLLILIKVTENFQSCLYEMSLIYLDKNSPGNIRKNVMIRQ